MAMVDPQINDHLTRVQLRLMRERLAAEQERHRRLASPAQSASSNTADQTRRVDAALQKRQELLDKIKRERELHGHVSDRPRSLRRSARDYPQTLPSPAPSRRSLPDMRGRTSRHVIEHKFKTSSSSDHSPTQHHAPPHPHILQPLVVNSPASHGAPAATQASSKAEFMEMMMMQNAQMHQMIMQQLMLSALPNNPQNQKSPQGLSLPLTATDLLQMQQTQKERSPSVHHHHYTPPPPQQPQQPQQQQYPYYTQLPPINVAQPVYPAYSSPRWHYPAEIEPLRMPKARKKKKVPTATLR